MLAVKPENRISLEDMEYYIQEMIDNGRKFQNKYFAKKNRSVASLDLHKKVVKSFDLEPIRFQTPIIFDKSAIIQNKSKIILQIKDNNNDSDNNTPKVSSPLKLRTKLLSNQIIQNQAVQNETDKSPQNTTPLRLRTKILSNQQFQNQIEQNQTHRITQIFTPQKQRIVIQQNPINQSQSQIGSNQQNTSQQTNNKKRFKTVNDLSPERNNDITQHEADKRIDFDKRIEIEKLPYLQNMGEKRNQQNSLGMGQYFFDKPIKNIQQQDYSPHKMELLKIIQKQRENNISPMKQYTLNDRLATMIQQNNNVHKSQKLREGMNFLPSIYQNNSSINNIKLN